MSLAAAQAMDDLADCLFEEADQNWPKDTRQVLSAMGMAHRKAAQRIRDRVANPPQPEVPEEYRKPGAGQRPTARD